MTIDDDEDGSRRVIELVRIVGPPSRAAIVVRSGKVVSQVVQLAGSPEITALTLACPRGRDGTLFLTSAPAPSVCELALRIGIRRVVLTPDVVWDEAERARWARAGLELVQARDEVAA